MNQTISLKWLFNKRFRVFYHILFWMFIFSDELLSILGVTEPLESIPEVLGRVLADMFVVYINIYYLMPEYLFKGRTKLYVFLTVLIIVLNESIF